MRSVCDEFGVSSPRGLWVLMSERLATVVLGLLQSCTFETKDILALIWVRRNRFLSICIVRFLPLFSNVAPPGVECVGDERLRLRCPITLERFASAPARGISCTHLQCFDLEAYLVSNYRTRAFNNRWRCPVCSLELRSLAVQTFSFDGHTFSNIFLCFFLKLILIQAGVSTSGRVR